MGILIQFPQPGTRTPPGALPSSQSAEQDVRLAAAYRRDLDRAVGLLLEHVESDAYDGVALILKPKSPANKPARVVGGYYRHRLNDAVDATMQLHLAIKLRAREQATEATTQDRHVHSQCPRDGREKTMDSIMQQQWNETTARYHRCEQMLRIAFTQQLRASPETAAILLSITQLHIETIVNCIWELVRQPGQTTPQMKLDTLNAIQLFRTARAHVSAWMPPSGQEAAYFRANGRALSESMLHEGNTLLKDVEAALERIVGEASVRSVGT